ncbi:MAG: hypothetical protein RLY78_1103 [Pseudomonadota bacterium]
MGTDLDRPRTALGPLAARDPAAAAVLRLLRAHDGSMTRAAEALSGGPVHVIVHAQAPLPALPAQAPLPPRDAPPPGPCLQRLISLCAADGTVLLDSLSYLPLAGLDAADREALLAGRTPIGQLLDGRWQRRHPVEPAPGFWDPLWACVGRPDPAAARAQWLAHQGGPSWLVAEVLRGGMVRAVTPA